MKLIRKLANKIHRLRKESTRVKVKFGIKGGMDWNEFTSKDQIKIKKKN